MKLSNLLFILLLNVGLFGIYACEGNVQTTTEEASTETVEEPKIPEKQYVLTAFSSSPEFPNAKISSYDYKDGKFDFKISSETYKLGTQTADAEQKMCANSGKGQHIHLIVDNAPYSAQYTANFEYDVADGDHYLLAFLSRSYHESIKTADAHSTKKITVANKSITSSEEITGPILHYSRPKGIYTGVANTTKVMLDFYVDNVTLGDDFKVIADINGEKHTIDTWQPYYIEGLPIGDNKVKLTLIDKAGNAVNAPMNPVERIFTLKADPAEEQ